MKLHTAFRRLLSGLLAGRCVGCGRSGAAICSTCLTQASYPAHLTCPQCRRPQQEALTCTRCRQPQSLVGGYAAYDHSAPIKQAIWELKYKGRRSLVAPLAGLVAKRLAAGPLWLRPDRLDLLVPVPLHPARERERGYNQAAVLAAALAPALGITYTTQLLHRQRATRPQVGLGMAARLTNVAAAFTASGDLRGKRVLLFDDVYTTGATLRDCARALYAAGVSRVYALTVARALAQRDEQGKT